MQFRWRTWIRVSLNTGAVIVILGGAPASADDAVDTVRWERARIRSADAALAAIVRTAAERSQAFQALVTRIDATDGIVYLDQAKCPGTRTACLFQQLRLAGSNRVLHVGVTVTRRSDIDIASSIAHELQHVWEVLQRRDVVSTEDMLGIWLTGLKLAKEPYETYEAIEAGIQVRRELSSTHFDGSH